MATGVSLVEEGLELVGLLADRPTNQAPGQLYFAYDTNQFFVADETCIWNVVGVAGSNVITVKEVDGGPSAAVDTIEFPNGTVTILGSVATVDTAAIAGFLVTATGHGLVLPAVGFAPAYVDTGGAYQLAQADDGGTLPAFMITEIVDANTLRILPDGKVNSPSHGLTVGEYYFCSTSTPGGLTAVEPVSDFSAPVLYVLDSDNVLVFIPRPVDKNATPTNGFIAVDGVANLPGNTVAVDFQYEVVWDANPVVRGLYVHRKTPTVGWTKIA